MRKTITTLSLLCLSTLALTACNNSAPIEDVPAPVPETGTIEPAPLPDADTDIDVSELISLDFTEAQRSEQSLSGGKELPTLVNIEESSATILLGGSGSCPPEILEANYNEDTRVLMINWSPFPPGEDVMCTMDYVEYESQLTAPEGVLDLRLTKTEFASVNYVEAPLDGSGEDSIPDGDTETSNE